MLKHSPNYKAIYKLKYKQLNTRKEAKLYMCFWNSFDIFMQHNNKVFNLCILQIYDWCKYFTEMVIF